MKHSATVIASVRSALVDSVDVVSVTGARIYSDHPRVKLDAATGQTDLIVPCAIIDLQGGPTRQRNLIVKPMFHLYAYAASGLEAAQLIDVMIEAIEVARICSKIEASFPVTDYNPQAGAYFARADVILTMR